MLEAFVAQMATNTEGVEANTAVLIQGLVQVKQVTKAIGLSLPDLEAIQRILFNDNICGGVTEVHSATLAQTQAADDQTVPSDINNESSTAPTAGQKQPPVVPEPVAKARIDGQKEEQEDIADIVARLEARKEGRWVSQDVFLDPDINASRAIRGKTWLRKNRETANIAAWSKKYPETGNPAIGKDKAGYIFERLGNDPNNYRYSYFLLKKFDRQSSSYVPMPSHDPNGK